MANLLLPFIVAAFLAVIFVLVLMPIARISGLVDHPAARKVHVDPTPLVGGLAVFFSLLATVYLFYGTKQVMPWFATAVGLMLLTGVLDDRFDIRVTTRVIIELIACLLMIYGAGWQLYDFGQLIMPGVLNLGWFAVPITVFAALGVINAFNMMDGMDGLAGSLFLVAVAGLLFLFDRAHHEALVDYLGVTFGAVAGFLLLNARFPWNRKARVFLGDSGSLMLGFILAWWFIRGGSEPGRSFAPITAVYLMAVPLLDTTTLIYKRVSEGKSPFNADQFHLHHAFFKAGFGVGQTCMAISVLALLLAGAGIVAELLSWPEYLRFYTFIAFAFCYFFYMRSVWRNRRFLGKGFIK